MIPPIIVTGCPRSGTSLTCGLINQAGAFGGEMRGPTNHNKKGMYENRGVVQIFKNYLHSNGYDPKAQSILPGPDTAPDYPDLRRDVESIMKRDGYKGGPWFFKTVKGCHFWPVIVSAFPQATWIIVERPRDQVVRSLLKTPFMKAYDTWEQWEEYVKTHERRFDEIERNVANCFRVNSNRIVNGQYIEVRTVIKMLGLEWDEAKVNEFVEPTFWTAA